MTPCEIRKQCSLEWKWINLVMSEILNELGVFVLTIGISVAIFMEIQVVKTARMQSKDQYSKDKLHEVKR